MDTEHYKTRTEDVRRAARSHLAGLRRARLAAKATSQKEAVTLDAVTGDLEGPSADAETSNAALAEMVEGAAAHSPIQDAGVVEAEAEDLLEAIDVPDEAQDAEDIARAVEEAPVETAAPPPAADTIEGAADAEPQDVIDAKVTAADPIAEIDMSSDLACLPGAGPGLVWMLNASGVHSLQDLAQQDPATLAEKLGVVGQIINVDHWVTLAKAGPRTH